MSLQVRSDYIWLCQVMPGYHMLGHVTSVYVTLGQVKQFYLR
jgi:hypothetical protein